MVGVMVRLLKGAKRDRPPVPIRDAYLPAGVEPDLEEVLADPIVPLVARRAGLEPADMRRVIDDARLRLAGALPPRP